MLAALRSPICIAAGEVRDERLARVLIADDLRNVILAEPRGESLDRTPRVEPRRRSQGR
jgi:hypothetical protein